MALIWQNTASRSDAILAEYLSSEQAIAQCSYKLLHSELFQAHKDYVRRQIVYGLLQVWGSHAHIN